MTVIVTCADDDKLVIGSDRQVSYNGLKSSLNEPKLFFKPFKIKKCEEDISLINARLVFAVAGSVTISQYIKYGFTIPDYNLDEFDSDEGFLYNVMYVLKNELIKQGIVTIDNSELNTESQLLIIFKNNIYEVENNLGLLPKPSADEYYAIGSGTDLALGSLYSTKDSGMSAVCRVKKAISSSAYHTLYVDENIDLYTLTLNDYYE